MAGRHKSFDVEKLDPTVRDDALTFDIAGQTFKCRSTLPGWLLLRFVALSASSEQGSDALALYEFFGSVLEPESYELFKQVMSGDEYKIDMGKIGEIANWLISEYTARPTQQPSSSQNGDGTTGTSSEVNVDSTASIPTNSTPQPSST